MQVLPGVGLEGNFITLFSRGYISCGFWKVGKLDLSWDISWDCEIETRGIERLSLIEIEKLRD